MQRNFRIIQKFTCANVCKFYILFPNGEYKLLADVLMPNDGQLNENVGCANEISDALRKRVRKSI
jgi:hypothetical protein